MLPPLLAPHRGRRGVLGSALLGGLLGALAPLRQKQLPGPLPDAPSYNAPIGACEKGRRGQEVLAFLRHLQLLGRRPDAIGCNASISAREKGGRRLDALALLRQMQRPGPRPDVISYSASIGACGKGRRWPGPRVRSGTGWPRP